MKLPNGFTAASCAAGLKSSGALDLTLIVNNGPLFDAAAVYTSNQVVAAPVIWSKQVTKEKIVRAAILNSGGANACTGPQGFADTHKTAEHVGEVLEISSGDRVQFSTHDARGGALLDQRPTGTAFDLPKPIPGKGNPVTGPIAIKGAKPGDALLVHILSITCDPIGWCGGHAARLRCSRKEQRALHRRYDEQ
jgi:hypothetical protein